MPVIPIRILVSDLDGTLLGRDVGGARRFAAFWAGLAPRSRPWLCYSSGRLGTDIRASLPATGLPDPDFIIGGVGTSLTTPDGKAVAGFTARFHDGWDRALVQEAVRTLPGLTAQPLRFQSPFKASWFLHDASPSQLSGLTALLAAMELRVTVVYSSNRDLDILPELAGKGHAMRWLCTHLGLALTGAVVAGDSENDLAMFRLPRVRGILVANAAPGLVAGVRSAPVYRAKLAASDGVIEGLRAYGLGAPTSAPTKRRVQPRKPA